jgi:hypothetical protein
MLLGIREQIKIENYFDAIRKKGGNAFEPVERN